MNRFITLILLSCIFSYSMLAEEKEPLTLAVLDFESSEERLEPKAEALADLVSALLSAEEGIWMVERAELDDILGEQTISLSGLAKPGTAAQVGNLTGAKVLVTGKLIDSAGETIVVAKLISTQSSRLFGETVTATAETPLSEIGTALVAKLIAVMKRESAILNPPSPNPETQLTAWRELLEGYPRPSISVHITEEDLRQPMIDPAVETEFQKTLLALDFEVIDTASAKTADIAITGEAFSQPGARRGQLVSARARTEVKMVRTRDDTLLASDRATAGAIDTSSAVAGKAALQKTARPLIDQLLHALVQSQ